MGDTVQVDLRVCPGPVGISGVSPVSTSTAQFFVPQVLE